ncbi:MAG: hypothetical protein WC314_27340 [Vulcanimicrobiota bacterium]
MAPQPAIEHPKPCVITALAANSEQAHSPLKKLIKDKDLKKQHHDSSIRCTSGASLVRLHNNDDEPLHKICLKGLREHGVSQRVSRKLCNDHNHELILSVLKTAPHRPGIQNLAAYIVSEIQDGGYEQAPAPMRPLLHEKDGGHQKTGDRRPSVDAPIAYCSSEQTKEELQKIEVERLQREQVYQERGAILSKRFKTLAEEVQLRLKLLASIELTRQLPQTSNREQMLKDKTFQRLANRTVLERFFDWIDKGFDTVQALYRLESSFA